MNLYADVLCNIIIQTYLMNNKCLIIFTDKSNEFYYNGSLPIVNIKVDPNFIQSKIFLNHFGCNGIIIKSNKPSIIFKEFEKDIRLSKERFNKRRFIIIPGTNILEIPSDIFSLQETEYVTDIVVIETLTITPKRPIFSIENEETYQLWTHKYVGSLENHKQKEFLDKWYSSNKSFYFNSNLFPDKLSNQQGRIFKMATVNYGPYSTPGSSLEQHKGSELKLMISFAYHYNMTPEVIINVKDLWGVIFENWTGTGVLGIVVDDKADVGFAGLYLWEDEYNFLDFSATTLRTGVTVITPAPKIGTGWLTPMYSYSFAMWKLVGATFIVCILIYFLMIYLETQLDVPKKKNKSISGLFGNSVFVVFKVFIVQIIKYSEVPPGRNGALFIAIIIMFSLFLSTTYSSGLATVMTIPRFGIPINTVDKFYKSGLYWYGTTHLWIDSIESATDPVYRSIVDHFIIIESDEKLRELSLTYQYAFVTEKLPNKNFGIGSYIKSDVIDNYILMNEDFYWTHSLIMTRKSAVYLAQLNSFILRSYEAGLIPYWQNEAAMLFMDPSVQRAVHYFHPRGNFVVKLSVAHVKGVFSILFMGYISSTIIFMLEILINRYYKN